MSYFISEDSVAIALFAIRIVGLKERQMWRLNRSVVEEVVILGAVALFFVLAVLIPAEERNPPVIRLPRRAKI